jgi:hypothetical protein
MFVSFLIARNATVTQHTNKGYLIQASQHRESIQAFATTPEVTFGLLSTLSAAWLSEK